MFNQNTGLLLLMIHVVYEGSDHCRKNYISRLIPLLLLFFFTSIKVLRFQRKTLYIVIALFLFLYYEGLPFSTLNLIVIALFLFHYYYYCYFCNFFLKNASADFDGIFRLTLDTICKKITRHIFIRRFRSRDIKDFIFLLVHNLF